MYSNHVVVGMALPGGAGAPIIAVTASAFEDDRREAIEAGATDFLSKPFRNRELFEKIGRLTGAEYVFEDAAADTEPGVSVATVSPVEVVEAFPDTLRERLHEATIRADFDELLRLLDEAAAHAPAVADQLRERLERFDYPSVLALLQPGEIEV